MQPDLTVVLVSWNVRQLLVNCLPSIFDKTHDISIEVVLVDNRSEDGTVEWCRQTWPDVEVVALHDNLGFSGGNNEGLKIARGRHVMLLNTDTIVKNGALDKLVKYLDDHHDVGAVGPKLLNEDGSLQRSCRTFPSLWTEFCQEFYLSALFPKSMFFSRFYMGWWDHDETKPVDFVTGAALVVRGTLIDKIGLLDDNMSFMFYEEIDWCLRLKKNGSPIVYLNEAEIVHLGGASYRHMKSQVHFHMLNSRFNYHRKHFGILQIPLLWLIHVVSGVFGSIALTLMATLGIKKEASIRMRRRYLDTLSYLRKRLVGTHQQI